MADFKTAHQITMKIEGGRNQGEKNPRYRHGGKGTRLYEIWKGVRKRCNNKNSSVYKWYGGKGITVCEEWDDFEAFRRWSLDNGYADNLTIDRKDGNKNYTPENCRWVTTEVQHKNQSNTRRIIVDGVELNINEASQKYSIHPQTIISRLNKGVDPETAVKMRPIQQKRIA